MDALEKVLTVPQSQIVSHHEVLYDRFSVAGLNTVSIPNLIPAMLIVRLSIHG